MVMEKILEIGFMYLTTVKVLMEKKVRHIILVEEMKEQIVDRILDKEKINLHIKN